MSATLAVTALELETWRLLREEVAAEPAGRDALARWLARRATARGPVAELVERFASGETRVERFRAGLEGDARDAAVAFGFDGLSGVRFLNKLLAVAGADSGLERELRAAVQLPNDEPGARARLRGFVEVLRSLARGRRLSARDLQPARAAFFVSLCWHVQHPGEWPAFHLPVRRALARHAGLRAPGGDPAGDYVAFRATFLALQEAVGVGEWELEYLCRWQHTRLGDDDDESYAYPAARRGRGVGAATAPALSAPAVRVWERATTPPIDPEVPAGESGAGEQLGHTHLQWLLATLARAVGCRAWVAPNDRARVWEGAALGALSVKHFPPLAVDPPSRRLIELIDVVWLQGSNRVAAAFEVEHTTSVYSGLLRLADLAAVCPNLTFPLYVVAPEARLDKVRRELARPAFQALGLHRRCGFFSSEALAAAAGGMMRWATAPDAIERLAERVADTPSDELAG